MKQLPLPVNISEYMTFDSFFVGNNSGLIDALNDRNQKFIWVTGDSGTGKTHLLSALCNQYAMQGKRIQYLSMIESEDYTPSIIDGLSGLRLIAIDDAEYVIGQFSWEEKLMNLYETIIGSETRLVIGSKQTPKAMNFSIPDLASRFSLGLLYRINQLSDDDLIKAIQFHANVRGFELPTDSAKFLIKRSSRSVSSLMDILNILDYESLSSKRKLTIPFIKTVLNFS